MAGEHAPFLLTELTEEAGTPRQESASGRTVHRRHFFPATLRTVHVWVGLAAAGLLALAGTVGKVARAPAAAAIDADPSAAAAAASPMRDSLLLMEGKAQSNAAPAAASASASAAKAVPVAAGLSEAATGRSCMDVWGVKLAQDKEAQSVWEPCAKKWSEDCTEQGCCLDADMKCYKKNSAWASCKAKCKAGKDEKNETWACDVLAPPTPRTAKGCAEECKRRPWCRQSVFSADGGATCSLSQQRITKVAWAGDNFNSSLCGDEVEQDAVQAGFDEVHDQLPFRLAVLPVKTCSWGGEDCSDTKCCNDVSCDKNFTNCYGYSCYKKTRYFSGCRITEPPASWDGTWLGGGRGRRAIPPAGSQVEVQGRSLYCFAVVSWNSPAPKPFWDPESALANNIKQKGVGICQCDDHDFYDAIPTPKAEWGSFSNIDAFQQIWKEVKAKGVYKKHDWTVKVDCDAVFIPSRLKDHLYNLRTPWGAKVYLENIDFKFKFMGALEVLTRQALDVFLELGHTCIRGEHAGGEDFFMKGCMDAIGIDHQSDYLMLRDKYAGQDGPCTDGWAVAYHFHKKVSSWDQCYNEAVR